MRLINPDVLMLFQVQKIAFWLRSSDCIDNITPQKLSMVLYEVESNAIGIWAGEMFAVSYRIIFQCLLVIMTLFIACVVEK